jgi:hypothetical protein
MTDDSRRASIVDKLNILAQPHSLGIIAHKHHADISRALARDSGTRDRHSNHVQIDNLHNPGHANRKEAPAPPPPPFQKTFSKTPITQDKGPQVDTVYSLKVSQAHPLYRQDCYTQYGQYCP